MQKISYYKNLNFHTGMLTWTSTWLVIIIINFFWLDSLNYFPIGLSIRSQCLHGKTLPSIVNWFHTVIYIEMDLKFMRFYCIYLPATIWWIYSSHLVNLLINIQFQLSNNSFSRFDGTFSVKLISTVSNFSRAQINIYISV